MKSSALVLALPTLLALSCTAATAAWPAYRGPHGDGSTPEAVGKKMWPAAGPKKLWTTETPTGFSSFTVADGHAYTLIQRDIDGVPTEVCVALDAATGKELWAAPLKMAKYDGGGNDGAGDNKGGDGPRSTPTVAGGRVYVLGASLDLHALDAATGKPVWSKDIIAEYAGRNIQWKSAASPLLEDGLIYVAGGGEGQSLLAFNADTGALVWKGQDDKMTHATPVAATIHGVRQIIFFTQTGLVSLGAKDGALLWRYNFPYRISTAASPLVYNDMVYCAAGYGVGMGCAKITKNGASFEAQELWRKEGDKVTNHWSTPVVKEGKLYGMFSFKKYGKGPVTCLDMATGSVLWSEDGFGPGNLILSGGDTLVALSDKGELVLIAATPDKYKELARADVLDGKCWSTPVLANGVVFARSTKEGVAVDVSK